MSMAVKAWSYSGRDSDGKLVKGKLDAPTQGAVVTRLKGMGVAPVAIAEAGTGTGLNREITIGDFGVKKVKLKELAVMSRQMSTMISAGLSLLRTLSILADQTESKKLRQTLAEVKTDVEGGGSLSSAMAKHPDDFPMLMVSLVRAGETGGFLEGALTSVAENYEKEHKLRSTIKSALTYPVVVLFMTLLAVIGMIVFIVPVFKTMFEGLGTELPLPTQILVMASESAVVWVPVLAVIVIGFSFWYSEFFSRRSR
jgi:type IV pilus assembly protein PilC